MLSYRHAYHAGNHADVLKHLVLMLTLEHFNSKDKPYLALDTHAGAGIYSLHADAAQRTSEYQNGIARIWLRDDLPPALASLRHLIRQANRSEKLMHYPGSPWIIRTLTRTTDRLRFCELHPTDHALLKREFGETSNVTLEKEDGFLILKAALPPVSRRGLVLMDPSYEIKSDYGKVVAAVKDALERFATGTFLVWYPLLPLTEAHILPERLRKAGASHWLDASLCVRAPATDGHGMHGSGMFVVNPPWQLAAALNECLPYLAKHLATDDRATWNLESYEQPASKPATSRK
jgi:23S rRNA (adenine2030-N6)-methyltransferase